MTRICVSGEALVDFVPDQNGMRQWTPGGSGLNTALALARLDVETFFAGTLSKDEYGTRLADLMRAEKIDLSVSLFSDKPCPSVDVSKDAQGSPHYDLHLDGSALEEAPHGWSVPPHIQHIHATSFAATLGPSGDATLATLREARSSKKISTSFDPNIRASVFPDRSLIPALLAQRIQHADIVKISREDLDVLAPGVLHDHILGEWRAWGVKLLIITCGDQGAFALSGAQQIHVPSQVVNVCDTIGAGDTFMGALLAAMAQEECLGRMADVYSADQLTRWLTFANQAAGFCCTRAGAQPPRHKDIEAQR